ncbi:MAG: HAMP domain-containing protein [Acidobacteria bacterium]|nr:HAMP domain-containing protein [Acidobacteriota bacterium]
MDSQEPRVLPAAAPPDVRLRWWQRLGVKVVLVSAVVTFGLVALFVGFTLRQQQRYMTQEVLRGAAQFSDTLKAATYHFMLADERESAYRAMRTVGGLDGIHRVRMLNKEGRVTFSTDDRETGRMVDKGAEACYACHQQGQPLVRLNTPSRSRIFEQDGQRVLAMITPIYNEASCSTASCHAHSPDQQVLGVMDVSMSLREEDAAVASLRRSTLLLAGLAVLALAAFGALFLRWYVTRPLADLVAATGRIAEGDLDLSVAVRRTDEIGVLAGSFNTMTSSLREARAELQRLNEGLERQVAERTSALRDAQAQLVQSEKMSSLGKLAASVAHEINNPLSGILTYAKLLIRLHEEGELTAQAREACTRNLRLVQRETERCSAIVRNLLDFARQRPPTLKDLDLSAVAEEALSLLAHRLQMQNVTLVKDLASLPTVRADFGQMRQAFVNIALNAAEAMAEGGTLTVRSRVEGGMAAVEFADSGPGIPPEHLSRILDPFFTTKEKGTGLGLSVVYGLIERHAGKLDISSRVGQGTTVVIRLPIAGAGTEAAV